jgi:hypothetical protein
MRSAIVQLCCSACALPGTQQTPCTMHTHVCVVPNIWQTGTFCFLAHYVQVWDGKEDGTAPSSPKQSSDSRRSLSRSSITSSSNPASAVGSSAPEKSAHASGTAQAAGTAGNTGAGVQAPTKAGSTAGSAPPPPAPAAVAGGSKGAVTSAVIRGTSTSSAALSKTGNPQSTTPLSKSGSHMAATVGNDTSPKGVSGTTKGAPTTGYRAVNVSGPVTLKDAVMLTSSINKRCAGCASCVMTTHKFWAFLCIHYQWRAPLWRC